MSDSDREASATQSRFQLPHALWQIARNVGATAVGRTIASRWPLPVRTTVQGGAEIYVDLRSSIGRGLFATGTFDMAAIQPALDALHAGDIFVDIGANIGFYTLLASQRVGPTGQVYCFEIDPRPLRCLRKTIAYLDLNNVHVAESAVSDVDGLLSFVPADEHGHNRIERNSGAGLSIQSVRIDSWAEQVNVPRIDVIKIDVEGAEKLVLDGARETIKRFKPLILAEASDQAQAFGYRPEDLITVFAELGYAADWVPNVWTPTLLAKPTNGT